MNAYNYLLALPEIFLLGMLCVIVLLEAFWGKCCPKLVYVCSVISAFSLAAFCWFTRYPIPMTTFDNMFVVDNVAMILKGFLSLAVALVFVYSKRFLEDKQIYRGEFYILALFALLGGFVMVSAKHFVSLYLGLEILSLSMYALIALQRDAAKATEAALKYFVLGALASGLFLYGISLIYGATAGQLGLSEVASAIASGTANSTLLSLGLVFVVAGFAFKLGTVPFHMWVPDVYQGAATPMTMFIGSAPKLAAFAFVLRILAEGLPGLFAQWQGMLVFCAVLSLVLGNVVAIAQKELKRMLAYSTISHMGFLLLSFVAGSLEGYQAGMVYAILYALTTLAGFGLILLLSNQNKELEEISDLKGLNKQNPMIAALFALVMFSMAGIPPAAGFIAKLGVLSALVDQGLAWLAVIAVICSLIGAFYYLRIVKIMYFDAPSAEAAPCAEPSFWVRAVLVLNCLALLVLGVLPNGLLAWCAQAMRSSFGV